MINKNKILKFLIKKLKYASEDSIYKYKNKEEYFIYYHPILEDNSYSIHLSLNNSKYKISLFKKQLNPYEEELFSFDNEFDSKTLEELDKIYLSLKTKVESSEEKYKKNLENLISKHNL
jgi:hypothetical protein